MDQDSKKIITAIGAMCEIAGFMYKQLIANGFPEERAFEIVAEYFLNTILSSAKQSDEEGYIE